LRDVEESMCETSAYVIEGDREVLLLQDVISIRPENGSLRMVNLFGEEKIVPGRIKQIDLLAHKILIVS
jgi:predicted RNA-binding protein